MHRPLRGEPQCLAAFCLSQTPYPLFFTTRCYGAPLSCTEALGLGTQYGAETPCSSWGTSEAEISLPILNHDIMGVKHAHYMSLPFLPVL